MFSHFVDLHFLFTGLINPLFFVPYGMYLHSCLAFRLRDCLYVYFWDYWATCSPVRSIGWAGAVFHITWWGGACLQGIWCAAECDSIDLGGIGFFPPPCSYCRTVIYRPVSDIHKKQDLWLKYWLLWKAFSVIWGRRQVLNLYLSNYFLLYVCWKKV